MKIRTIGAVVATVFGLCVSFAEDTQSAVKVGEWGNEFAVAKAFAEEKGIPMLVFWDNPGCSQCAKMKKTVTSSIFTAWQAERKLVMVNVSGTGSEDARACKAFAKNSSGQFPYMAVYWKSVSTGNEVLVKFTGRSGSIGNGANSKDSLDKQLMTAVDTILARGDSANLPEVGEPEPAPEPPAEEPAQPTEPEEPVASEPPAEPEPPTPESPAEEPVQPTEPEKPAEPAQPTVVDVNMVYKNARTLSAVVRDNDAEEIAGTAKVSLGKIKKGAVKVSVSVSLFSGKSVSAGDAFVPDEEGAIEGVLKFKAPVGTMEFSLQYDSEEGEFVLEGGNDDYFLEFGDVKLGGPFETDELSFSADIGDAEDGLPEDYEFVVDAPAGEPVYVKKGTKLSCAKAPSIKYKKEDGVYSLVGLDDDVKTNVNAVKLSYNAKKGTFSGSFKVYASNESAVDEKKPSLKSYSAKVSGIVINGEGVGKATLKIGKRIYIGTCSFE